MEYYQNELKEEIEFYEFIQYEFYRQWYKLKKYANDNGVKIIGDIPIYVAYVVQMCGHTLSYSKWMTKEKP